jgi:selenocysteine lyase/cysteine desulfurase
VDGVAFAPHRAIDVAAWDADWYVYSTYKVFGPHMGAMFGKNDAFAEIKGPNHFFLPDDNVYKFELGGCSHEGCAGLLALRRYLNFVNGAEGDEIGRSGVVDAWDRMEALEMPLQRRFMEYLNSRDDLTIYGPAHGGAGRVATISFASSRKPAPAIVAEVDKHPIGIRCGHMYAYRLCQRLGIDTGTGVVRASFAHYNMLEEIERLIEVLDVALAA